MSPSAVLVWLWSVVRAWVRFVSANRFELNVQLIVHARTPTAVPKPERADVQKFKHLQRSVNQVLRILTTPKRYEADANDTAAAPRYVPAPFFAASPTRSVAARGNAPPPPPPPPSASVVRAPPPSRPGFSVSMSELLSGKKSLRKVALKSKNGSPARKSLTRVPVSFTPLKSTSASVQRSPGGTPFRQPLAPIPASASNNAH
jgi:hypothetical protein